MNTTPAGQLADLYQVAKDAAAATIAARIAEERALAELAYTFAIATHLEPGERCTYEGERHFVQRIYAEATIDGIPEIWAWIVPARKDGLASLRDGANFPTLATNLEAGWPEPTHHDWLDQLR